jgi:hypothetical protein
VALPAFNAGQIYRQAAFGRTCFPMAGFWTFAATFADI